MLIISYEDNLAWNVTDYFFVKNKKNVLKCRLLTDFSAAGQLNHNTAVLY